jgi:hypothetical protein
MQISDLVNVVENLYFAGNFATRTPALSDLVGSQFEMQNKLVYNENDAHNGDYECYECGCEDTDIEMAGCDDEDVYMDVDDYYTWEYDGSDAMDCDETDVNSDIESVMMDIDNDVEYFSSCLEQNSNSLDNRKNFEYLDNICAQSTNPHAEYFAEIIKIEADVEIHFLGKEKLIIR